MTIDLPVAWNVPTVALRSCRLIVAHRHAAATVPLHAGHAIVRDCAGLPVPFHGMAIVPGHGKALSSGVKLMVSHQCLHIAWPKSCRYGADPEHVVTGAVMIHDEEESQCLTLGHVLAQFPIAVATWDRRARVGAAAAVAAADAAAADAKVCFRMDPLALFETETGGRYSLGPSRVPTLRLTQLLESS